jgi:hypothetical protein
MSINDGVERSAVDRRAEHVDDRGHAKGQSSDRVDQTEGAENPPVDRLDAALRSDVEIRHSIAGPT